MPRRGSSLQHNQFITQPVYNTTSSCRLRLIKQVKVTSQLETEVTFAPCHKPSKTC